MKHRLLAVAAAALLASLALPARAQGGRAPTASDLGGALRLGVAAPSGASAAGERLGDLFGPQLDLAGELGVRVTPQLLLGGTLGFGFGSPGSYFDPACGGGSRCGAWTARLGLLAHWDFAPWSPVSPWIAYGVGFSAAGASGDLPGSSFDYSYAGVDLARLSAGLDFTPPGGRLGLGLYAEWVFGVYKTTRQQEAGVVFADGRIRDQTVHQWFSIGPRLSF